VSSFQQLGQMLQRQQVPFTLIDHEFLAAARAAPEGTLVLRDRHYRTLMLPQDVELPEPAATRVAAFRQAGATLLADAPTQRGTLRQRLPVRERLDPPSDRIALGRFVRDGQQILLLANVGREAYRGQLATAAGARWTVLDPATGNVQPADQDPAGQVALSLAARQAVLLISP
jgi:hypothetical protein